MDTREKIIAPGAAILRRGKLCAFVGHFDPMYAAHARRLNELHSPGDTWIVILTDPAQPLLQTRARAELVAALKTVDYVVPAQDNTVEDILAQLAPDQVWQEEEQDLKRAAALVNQVRSRQNAS